MSINQPRHILVCPLDWGLGHATRCIPIINEFQKKGYKVFVASSGQALKLLKNEYPQLGFEELPAYNPHYYSALPMTISMALQLPKFIKTISQEHEQLERIVIEKKIDLVVSDNRYGCWSSHVKSIFITHQVNMCLGF
jgi:UDP:flavonoid glycosyltransferase YjiC (YdhE family)